MKLLNPDASATTKYKTSVVGTDLELTVKEGFTLRETNAMLGLIRYGDHHEANVYGVSAVLQGFVTKVEDHDGNVIKKIPREEFETNGVHLIAEDFLESLPRLLFMELARLSISLATGSRITDEDVKN